MSEIPLGRHGTPRDVGAALCFLASARAAYISGTSVGVDGGMYSGLL
jgi:3-oxoacyl-[acyl-carrier protein] reductase